MTHIKAATNIRCHLPLPAKFEIPSLDEDPPNPTPKGGWSPFLPLILFEVHPSNSAEVHLIRAYHRRLTDELVSEQDENKNRDRRVCRGEPQYLVFREFCWVVWPDWAKCRFSTGRDERAKGRGWGAMIVVKTRTYDPCGVLLVE